MAARFEQVFAGSFAAAERTTLAVVCFPLGTWVGGLYTLACARHLAAKGYPITVVAPGNNKAEILRVIPELAAALRADRAAGLPAVHQGRDRHRDRRGAGLDRVCDQARAGRRGVQRGVARPGRAAGRDEPSPCYDSASLYGTADAGRARQRDAAVDLRSAVSWPPGRRPPGSCSARHGCRPWSSTTRAAATSRRTTERCCSPADSGVPLVRYHIADEGGLIGYQDMLAFCGRHGFDPMAELRSAAAGRRRGVRPLPFVYVFGRSHFAVSYFGANVYPENVDRRPGAAGRQRLGDRQVRARGGRGRRRATAICPSRSSWRPARRPTPPASACSRSRSARSCSG